jgi:hypothetical protein
MFDQVRSFSIVNTMLRLGVIHKISFRGNAERAKELCPSLAAYSCSLHIACDSMSSLLDVAGERAGTVGFPTRAGWSEFDGAVVVRIQLGNLARFLCR